MENYKFRYGTLSFTKPIFGILFLIYPTFIRIVENRDFTFIILYLLIILYCCIEIFYKLYQPYIKLQDGLLIVKKYFFLTKNLEIGNVKRMEWDSLDVILLTSKEKLKIDSKDIHKQDRDCFIKFINKIKINNNI
jgi:hypothetical protein